MTTAEATAMVNMMGPGITSGLGLPNLQMTCAVSTVENVQVSATNAVATDAVTTDAVITAEDAAVTANSTSTNSTNTTAVSMNVTN